jgi:hypothetical protein
MSSDAMYNHHSPFDGQCRLLPVGLANEPGAPNTQATVKPQSTPVLLLDRIAPTWVNGSSKRLQEQSETF